MEEKIITTANILKAMGHPTRLKILFLLNKKPHCVCELLDILKVSQPNLSQHLALLRNIGLIKDERKANMVFYSLENDFVKKILSLLE
ncbi:MAG: hypothetical protein PWP54_1617 [Thermosipho sp. (in: thermotogales)]|nr:hypothetical protein [Thermosipho sp. (in: thermotogales)]MDK2907178.1 hypothetical protein [Petrotoga sp.]